MENQQPPAQPLAPQQQPAPQQSVQPAPAAQPAPQQPAAPAPAAKPAAALPKDQTKANKNLVIGCLTAFGCSIIIFLGVLFAFLAFGSTDNPIFGFLGVPPTEVVNVLIALVNLIFLVLVFAAFIFAIIGIFKITTAKKEDKPAKRKGALFAFGSLAAMLLLIFIWIFAYVFLAARITIAPTTAIATLPEKTINLTAPIKVKFDAIKAPINKKQFDILSYNWNFDDGTTLTGNPQTHTFTQIGNFKVTLTITVKEKVTGKEQEIEFTHDVTVQNVTANVIIKADKQKGIAPLTVNLDGSQSNSPNGEITGFSWDLDEDGQFDDGAEETAQVAFDKIGAYKVGLRVTDSTGAFATGELEIEALQPDTPTAVIEVEGVTGTELQTDTQYVFTAAASTSPAGKIEKYSWDFGDGEKASSKLATHIYKNAGEYEVTLIVIDSAKKKGESIVRFSVAAPSAPPLVSLKTTPEAKNGVISGKAPFDVIFDASASQDPNNDIVQYSWDFNNDSQMDDANAVTSYQFTNAGMYNVSLTITDSANLSTKSQVVVKVEPAGIKAAITADPIEGIIPLTVKFDASGSSYPEGKIVNYEWDFGDGSAPRTDTAKVSYKYLSVGTFTAKVTAIGADNARSTTQMPINVRPVPVKACFTPSATSGKIPLEVFFDPTCSTGTIVKYNWNFANLAKSTDFKAKFTFKNPGEYNVSLEVTDSQNVVDTFTSKITVELP